MIRNCGWKKPASELRYEDGPHASYFSVKEAEKPTKQRIIEKRRRMLADLRAHYGILGGRKWRKSPADKTAGFFF